MPVSPCSVRTVISEGATFSRTLAQRVAHFGADIAVLDSVLREIAPVATQTHPAFAARLRAAHAGYSDYVLENAFTTQQPYA